MKELLLKLDACIEARRWAGCLTDKECVRENITNQVEKSWQEIFDTCPRGDWLLWLFYRTRTDSEQDFALLTIAKGHCANTVRHLMKDERSLKAVDAAMNYNGDRVALKSANAANAADAAAYAAYAADAADAAADADAARKESLSKALDLIRLRLKLPYQKEEATK